jgi:hypothetical protein
LKANVTKRKRGGAEFVRMLAIEAIVNGRGKWPPGDPDGCTAA